MSVPSEVNLSGKLASKGLACCMELESFSFALRERLLPMIPRAQRRTFRPRFTPTELIGHFDPHSGEPLVFTHAGLIIFGEMPGVDMDILQRLAEVISSEIIIGQVPAEQLVYDAATNTAMYLDERIGRHAGNTQGIDAGG